MTSSIEIENYLKDQKGFLGCFASDNLPTFPKSLPASLIINTHKKSQPGEHWLALVLTKHKCFYFDSFGLPIVEEYILKFLEPHYNVVTYSDVCIQHIGSHKCGEFSLLFVKHVNSKTTYNKFLSHFNHKNLKENDVIVEQWMGNV